MSEQNYPQGSPKAIIQKHDQLDPQLVICMSDKDGQVTIDISSPGTVGQLLLMQKMLDNLITKIIFEKK